MTATREQTARYFSGRHVADTSLGAAFHAATVGGANALGRDRLGRDAETLSPLVIPLVERSEMNRPGLESV